MKEFWKDYNDMCIKPQTEWMKKHWKGYTILLGACFVGGYVAGAVIEHKDGIGDKVKHIFKKEDRAE